MSWHDLELMARGGTMALLALLCWILWRDHRQALPARLAITMCVAIACYVAVTAGWAGRQSLPGLALAIGAGATPGLFWLFAKTWFNDRSQLALRDQLLVLLSVANVFLLQMTFPAKTPVFFASAALFRVGMFAFAAAGLWEAWRGRAGDLVEGRRRLRLGLVGVVGAYVLAIGIAEISVYDGDAPQAIIALIGSSTVLATLAFCAAMFGSRQTDLFGTGVLANQPQPQIANDDPLVARLRAHMETQMPHRDEALTIAVLARQLDEQEYRLRRLINGTLGHRNFAQFLNSYRLTEVRSALADPAQREVPILTIALDAGFGSLGPFNRAFREAEGMTPREYRAARLADSGIG